MPPYNPGKKSTAKASLCCQKEARTGMIGGNSFLEAIPCFIFPAFSGVLFSLVYIKRKYRRRFAYVKKSVSFYLFLSAAAIVSIVAYAILKNMKFQFHIGNGVENQVWPFISAFISGATLFLGRFIGMHKKGHAAADKKFLDIITLLLEIIEEDIESQVDRHILKLSTAPRIRSLSAIQIASGLEKVVAHRFINDAKQRKMLTARISVFLRDDNRLGLLSLSLEFFSPECVKREFADFCRARTYGAV
jgi:hypothetical protein